MFQSRIVASCTLVLLVLPGLALPGFALADGKAALTYGYEQNGYRAIIVTPKPAIPYSW